MTFPAGLYIVKAGPTEYGPGGRVWVVVAEDGQDAAEQVANNICRDTQTTRTAGDTDHYEVGRLGSYEPGIGGARLMQAAGGVIG